MNLLTMHLIVLNLTNYARGSVQERRLREMVHKETCPSCKGNKWVDVKRADGHSKSIPCPHCAGEGYCVRVTLAPR